MIKFIAPDLSDKRISYASQSLQNLGYQLVNSETLADFALVGIGTDKSLIPKSIPTIDYKNDEGFAVENAYLTAEAALSLATNESDTSLCNSSVLIVGYGRIGKALHKYLSVYTNNITVCARRESVRQLAEINSAKAIGFNMISSKNDYDFIFNTVVHPVINDAELSSFKSNALVMELASFPGGVDTHCAAARGVKLVIARGLPGKVSPKTAGEIVAKTVDKIIREE